uniref:Uncharacterized protein n=1 Tax=Populus trichocarpa TaxID=3694 RepID=U5GH16_POPTR
METRFSHVWISKKSRASASQLPFFFPSLSLPPIFPFCSSAPGESRIIRLSPEKISPGEKGSRGDIF